MWNVQMDWGNSVCFLPSSVLVFGQWIGGGKTAAATGKLGKFVRASALFVRSVGMADGWHRRA